MFFDDRINAERGKAFRATLMFAWVASVIYLVAHFPFFLPSYYEQHTNLVTLYTFTEICFIVVSGLFISFGEIHYGITPRDEMIEQKKNTYYVYAFWISLVVLLLAFCINTTIQYAFFTTADGTIGFPSLSYYEPNHFLTFLEIPCWSVLLMFFKCRQVPLNYSFILDKKKDYVLSTVKNVGKIAIVTVCFILFSLLVLLWFVGEKDAYRYREGIIYHGIFSFASLAFQYVLFSWAEWLSEKAKEHGKISGATLTFGISGVLCCIIPMICTLIYHQLHISFSGDAPFDIVMLVLRYAIYFDIIKVYCIGLFTVYFFSEIRDKFDNRLQKYVKALICLAIINFIFDQFLSILPVNVLDSNIKLQIQFINISNIVRYTGQLIVHIITFILVRKILTVFIQSEYSKPSVKWFPFTLLAVKSVIPITALISIIFSIKNTVVYQSISFVIALMSCALGVVFSVWLIKQFNRSRK